MSWADEKQFKKIEKKRFVWLSGAYVVCYEWSSFFFVKEVL